MPKQVLLPDLTGCSVMNILWPDRGMQLVFSGKTAEGRLMNGATLILDAVANQYEVGQFLSYRRRLVIKTGYTDNKVENYALKLPCKLTTLTLDAESPVDYGDEAFTDAHGNPPPLRARQKRCLFALQEKRFKGRGPFPIIFERWTLTETHQDSQRTVKNKPLARNKVQQYAQLGMEFFEAIVSGDLGRAEELLSADGRKRLGKKGLRSKLGEFADCAKRFQQTIDQLRPLMSVNVETDQEIIWELVQDLGNRFPRESVRAHLELSAEFFREALNVFVVEAETGESLDLP